MRVLVVGWHGSVPAGGRALGEYGDAAPSATYAAADMISFAGSQLRRDVAA